MARQPGGRSKGWGLVDYESPEAASNVRSHLDLCLVQDHPSRPFFPSSSARTDLPAAVCRGQSAQGLSCAARHERDLVSYIETIFFVLTRSHPVLSHLFLDPSKTQQAIAQLHNSELQGRSIIVRLERAGGASKSGGGPNAGRPEASSGLQIVVRNLPWSTTSDDLRQVFQQVGNVVKAEAICHADTGRSKGWGTVLFQTREEAQAAIQGFNGVELEHRPMQIKLDRYD